MKIRINFKSWIVFIIIMFAIELIMLFTSLFSVKAIGYINYDSTTTWGGQTYYLYDLPPRYTADNISQVKMLFYNGEYHYTGSTTRQIVNNTWLKDKVITDLNLNSVEYDSNYQSVVSNPFNYSIYYTNSFNASNQSYFGLWFNPGYSSTNKDEQFYNPTTYYANGYYNFDFDIYLLTNNSNYLFGRFNNNNLVVGSQCLTEYSSNCFALSSKKGNNIEHIKVHATHVSFGDMYSFESELDNSLTNTNSNSFDNLQRFNYLIAWNDNFQNINGQNLVQYSFYISEPYNLKFWSSDSKLFLNGDRITNTDSINYANSNSCDSDDCQNTINNASDLFEELFGIDLVDTHGFSTILSSIAQLFNRIFSYNSNQCNNLIIPFKIRNSEENITISCGRNFWARSDMNTFRNTYHLIISGIMSYVIIGAFYRELLKVMNPDYLPDNKEVMKL